MALLYNMLYYCYMTQLYKTLHNSISLPPLPPVWHNGKSRHVINIRNFWSCNYSSNYTALNAGKQPEREQRVHTLFPIIFIQIMVSA